MARSYRRFSGRLRGQGPRLQKMSGMDTSVRAKRFVPRILRALSGDPRLVPG